MDQKVEMAKGASQLRNPREGDDPNGDWHRALAEAVRHPADLLAALDLPAELLASAERAAQLFPLMVPHSYLARMRRGDVNDPLLRQVLPLGAELVEAPGFETDAVGDARARKAPGLLHKYEGRALLIATGACAIHCRYCFRRHFPYGQEPRRLDDWQPAFDAIAGDESLHEILLSGGDPLMLTDARLSALIDRLEEISHVRRLRIHSRLPIVLPDRIAPDFLNRLSNTRLTPIMVVHANHVNELVGDCAAALRRLIQAGIVVLNQAVLLRGVNDTVEALAELCERLIDLGVLPYYLHQLDRVQGAAHFEVPEDTGRRLVEALRHCLPGYAVPRYVREVAGEPFKRPLSSA